MKILNIFQELIKKSSFRSFINLNRRFFRYILEINDEAFCEFENLKYLDMSCNNTTDISSSVSEYAAAGVIDTSEGVVSPRGCYVLWRNRIYSFCFKYFNLNTIRNISTKFCEVNKCVAHFVIFSKSFSLWTCKYL